MYFYDRCLRKSWPVGPWGVPPVRSQTARIRDTTSVKRCRPLQGWTSSALRKGPHFSAIHRKLLLDVYIAIKYFVILGEWLF